MMKYMMITDNIKLSIEQFLIKTGTTIPDKVVKNDNYGI